jgi:hypothetical protein
MDKIKRFFHSTTPNKKLKKRLSSILLLKSSIVEPRIKETTTTLSKSTSFLQLQMNTKNTTTTAIKKTIKKSRSMFGFDDTKQASSSSITENTASSTTLINASSTSINNTNSSSSILHTAAVSISSAHSTTIQQQLLISKDSGKKPDYLVQLGIQYYEKGELETAIHYWKLLTTLDNSTSNRMIGLGTFFYGLALRHGWVITNILRSFSRYLHFTQGCRKSPAIATRYLQKVATENTTDELFSAITRSCISKSMMTCLAVSIYELGEFFWHGWEVNR